VIHFAKPDRPTRTHRLANVTGGNFSASWYVNIRYGDRIPEYRKEYLEYCFFERFRVIESFSRVLGFNLFFLQGSSVRAVLGPRVPGFFGFLLQGSSGFGILGCRVVEYWGVSMFWAPGLQGCWQFGLQGASVQAVSMGGGLSEIHCSECPLQPISASSAPFDTL
jgi:hypothetical protein